MVVLRILISMLCLWIAKPARAQTPESIATAEALLEIRQLREAIRAQQQRLDDLEKKLTLLARPPKIAAPDPSSRQESTHTVDLSGYFSSNYVQLPHASEPRSFQQQTLSLFVGKSLGNWRFHSELEYEFGPELGPTGRPLGGASGDLALETAWLDYTHRDWLGVKAGILLTPTYWSTHHYPSTTLTVLSPLLHERIFPSNVNWRHGPWLAILRSRGCRVLYL